jgi:hypothetical protein
MLRIALAELRRLLLYFPFGFAIWFVIMLVIYRELAQECIDCTDPARQLQLTKLLFMTLIYGLGPAVGWAQGGQYGAPLATSATQKLTETLPLSLIELNLTRLLTGVAFMVPAALTWVATFAFWRYFGYPLHLWVGAFALLTMIAFQLLCLRGKVLRYLLPFLFPVLFIPRSEQVLRFAFEGG